ncbi:Uncharacterised protein [Vibrio cholerae]|nr:Uncharacterised protein [Vibrio cholerae]
MNGRFHFRIECGSGFVHDQDWRVFQEHACDRNTLTLAARQFHATFTDLNIIPSATLFILQLLNEIMSMSLASGFFDGGLIGIRVAVQNVIADRAVQQ